MAGVGTFVGATDIETLMRGAADGDYKGDMLDHDNGLPNGYDEGDTLESVLLFCPHQSVTVKAFQWAPPLAKMLESHEVIRKRADVRIIHMMGATSLKQR
jgi:hypothetical protein